MGDLSRVTRAVRFYLQKYSWTRINGKISNISENNLKSEMKNIFLPPSWLIRFKFCKPFKKHNFLLIASPLQINLQPVPENFHYLSKYGFGCIFWVISKCAKVSRKYFTLRFVVFMLKHFSLFSPPFSCHTTIIISHAIKIFMTI